MSIRQVMWYMALCGWLKIGIPAWSVNLSRPSNRKISHVWVYFPTCHYHNGPAGLLVGLTVTPYHYVCTYSTSLVLLELERSESTWSKGQWSGWSPHQSYLAVTSQSSMPLSFKYPKKWNPKILRFFILASHEMKCWMNFILKFSIK